MVIDGGSERTVRIAMRLTMGRIPLIDFPLLPIIGQAILHRSNVPCRLGWISVGSKSLLSREHSVHHGTYGRVLDIFRDSRPVAQVGDRRGAGERSV